MLTTNKYYKALIFLFIFFIPGFIYSEVKGFRDPNLVDCQSLFYREYNKMLNHKGTYGFQLDGNAGYPITIVGAAADILLYGKGDVLGDKVEEAFNEYPIMFGLFANWGFGFAAKTDETSKTPKSETILLNWGIMGGANIKTKYFRFYVGYSYQSWKWNQTLDSGYIAKDEGIKIQRPVIGFRSDIYFIQLGVGYIFKSFDDSKPAYRDTDIYFLIDNENSLRLYYAQIRGEQDKYNKVNLDERIYSKYGVSYYYIYSPSPLCPGTFKVDIDNVYQSNIHSFSNGFSKLENYAYRLSLSIPGQISQFQFLLVGKGDFSVIRRELEDIPVISRIGFGVGWGVSRSETGMEWFLRLIVNHVSEFSFQERSRLVTFSLIGTF